MKHTHKDYVCPICWHKIEECTCNFDNEYLIQIDEGMQEIVRIFNEKKYFTASCCEGHINDNSKEIVLCISFKNDPNIILNNWEKWKIKEKGTINYIARAVCKSKIKENRLSFLEEKKSIFLSEMLKAAKQIEKRY